MGSIYIYEADADDFSTIGICGALTPLSCTFHEIANGMSSLELEHPVDDQARYTTLQENRILKCDVPVRTTPEIAAGAFVTVIEKYTVKQGAARVDRYIYKAPSPSAKKQKKLKLVPVGGEVAVVAKYEDESLRWKVKYTWQQKKKKKWVSKTTTGYIDHKNATLAYSETVTVEDSAAGIEAVAPSWRIEEQLFRITSVEKSDSGVRVQASHISYDLMYDLTAYDHDGRLTLQQAADSMLAACFDDHQFTFQTNILGEKAGFHFRDKDPITALLDPETGLIPRWSGELVRDNFGFTVLDHAGIDRGTMFTYGKNVSGVSMSVDFSNVATAIRPVGETEKGKPVYLLHSYLWDGQTATALPDTDGIVYGRWHGLDDGGITCRLPYARIFPLTGDDCKENSKDGPQIADVRARLLQQAIEALENGESPEVSVNVDMALLGHTQQFDMYRELEKVFLFDTVRVRHPAMGIDVLTPVCEIEWDCIEDRPVSIATGEIHDLTSSVASWQISGVNGAKLAPGSVSSGQLADGAISTDHLQAGSVTTDALAAGSVTANKIAAGVIAAESITAVTAAIQTIAAQSVTTNALDAAYADIFDLIAQQISGTTVRADDLEAAIANLVSVTGTSAKFEIEDVKHLIGKVIQAEVLSSGLARIKNLYVTQANLMNATLDRLTLLAADGETYYDVSVGTDGNLIATERDPSSVDTSTGTTTDGRNVLDASEMEADTGMDVPDLDGLTAMLAEDGLLWVYTQGLSTGKLRATEAFIGSAQIDSLQTTAVEAVGNSMTFSANQVIQMLVGVKDQIRTWFSFGDDGLRTRKMTVDPDTGVVTPASKWSTYIDNEGFYIDHDDVLGHVGAFFREQAIFRSLQVTKTAQDEMNTAIRVRPTSKGGWVWTD